jgi:hypothetical protein
MQLTKKSSVPAALLLGVVVFSSLFAPQPAGADKPNPTQPVLVVNSANAPVPVAVQGTHGVSVIGPVDAQQSGPWTVGLAAGATVGLDAGTTLDLAPGATVTVANTAGAPVLVRNVDDAREPFQAYSGLVLFEPIPNVHSTNLAVVPDGKRLVIEHFSARIFNGSNGGPPFYSKLMAGGGVDILVPNQIGPGQPYMFNTETRMYASAGQSVSFETNINGQGYMEAFISGYLVPLP